MLEATKLRQSREIKDLRRKLREMRHKPGPTVQPNEVPMSPTSPGIRSGSGGSDGSDDEEEPEPDPAYDRICRLVETLLEQARHAVETTIDDFMPVSTSTVKVLSAAEVQQYERRRLGISAEEQGEGDDKREEDGDLSIDAMESSNNDIKPDPLKVPPAVDTSKRQPTLFSSGIPTPITISWTPD